MTSTPLPIHFRSQRLTTLGVISFLAITQWVARYWHSGRFGWYEDDLTIIPRAVQMTNAELWAFVSNYIINFYGHARPLSDSLIYLLSHSGWKLGGMWGAYWIGYGIAVLNASLFYTLDVIGV
jgi:hypothetical protein